MRWRRSAVKEHAGAMRATARCLAAEASGWPVLVTSVDTERADALKRLQELSDWVLTVDRNAGVEYFDAPGKRLKSIRLSCFSWNWTTGKLL